MAGKKQKVGEATQPRPQHPEATTPTVAVASELPDEATFAPEARSTYRPPQDGSRQCLAAGPGYETEDPNRHVWQIPQKCTRPAGHAGPCGFAPFKDEAVLIARWDDAKGHYVVVAG